MKDLRLIKNYENLFNTRQLDDFYDLLTENFYFKNPQIEIYGRDNYIAYVKDNQNLFTTNTLNIVATNTDEYNREYILTFLDTANKNYDELHILENIKISNGLISSVILKYDTSKISQTTQNLIVNACRGHGNVVKN